MTCIVMDYNLDKVRWPETAHPKETPLCRCSPHSGDEMEDVRFSSSAFQAKDLVIVSNVSINYDPQVAVG